jgi:hypothetical protein
MDITEAQKKFIDLMWANLKQAYHNTYNITYKKVTAVEMVNTVRDYIPSFPMEMNDYNYQVTTWKAWENIIQYDWTDRKKYIADTYDCDNFSDSFRAHFAEIFDLNSAGQFSCSVTSDDKKLVDMPHRAVMIVALDEQGKLGLWALESQSNNWTRVIKGQPIKIGSWTYKPSYSRWN